MCVSTDWHAYLGLGEQALVCVPFFAVIQYHAYTVPQGATFVKCAYSLGYIGVVGDLSTSFLGLI